MEWMATIIGDHVGYPGFQDLGDFSPRRKKFLRAKIHGVSKFMQKNKFMILTTDTGSSKAITVRIWHCTNLFIKLLSVEITLKCYFLSFHPSKLVTRQTLG